MGALGAQRDFLMGSVSQKVVALATTDVLVVRPPISEDPAEARKLTDGFRALVAVDGSKGSEAGIDSFAFKLRASAAAISLVHVVESLPALRELGSAQDRFETRAARHAESLLERALGRLGRHGLEAECECRRGSPAAQILEVARERETDLIVVGSRGHAGLREMVLGTITQRVLRHAPCSVFCGTGWQSSG